MTYNFVITIGYNHLASDKSHYSMKWPAQYAEHQESPSDFTKYRAYHEILS